MDRTADKIQYIGGPLDGHIGPRPEYDEHRIPIARSFLGFPTLDHSGNPEPIHYHLYRLDVQHQPHIRRYIMRYMGERST